MNELQWYQVQYLITGDIFVIYDKIYVILNMKYHESHIMIDYTVFNSSLQCVENFRLASCFYVRALPHNCHG